MPAPSLVLCLTLALAAVSLGSALVVHKRRQAEQQRVAQAIRGLQAKIDAALKEDPFDARRQAFSATLKAASLTTELQRPRLESRAKIDKKPPEKYRILTTLAAQGMEVEEIAALLGISRVEAGQLLSLSTMVRSGQ